VIQDEDKTEYIDRLVTKGLISIRQI
jgi:hypothetical protein